MTWQAVLFDLDGTLLETEAISLASGLQTFAAFGVPGDAALLHQLVGKDGPTGERILAQALPGLDVAAFAEEWALAARRMQAQGIAVKPGAHDLIARLTLPRAIVTSSFRDSAAAKLAAGGLPPFDVVVTFDDVANPKPAPDAYLLAAQRLAVDPARCLVFEDSDTGAQAAHAAGMAVVQVPDLLATDGRFATWLAPDLLTGARMAGLIPA